MIQFNKEETRQQRRYRERQQAKSGGPSPQQVLNAVLWKIITQNGGSVSFNVSELKDIPLDMAFNIQHTKGSINITAGTQKQRKEIIK